MFAYYKSEIIIYFTLNIKRTFLYKNFVFDYKFKAFYGL
jgi:hypothetical protein